ncbi:MAG: CD225/dispanin family protein [bacterium]|nr:CD225/dispanin family protein [bacterium]
MTKYWIRENGQQSGPFSLEELQLRTFAKGDTFVWHKGLEGWMHIENVPELAHLIAPESAAEPEQKAVESEAEVSETPKDMEETEEAEVRESTPPLFHSMPTPPPYMEQPQVTAPTMHEQTPRPECPPTNLVAAIVCTLLCCTPFGVAGIVCAVLTQNHYNAGNYEKARKYSQWSDWMCILSVVLFFLSLPFTILFL